MTATHRVPDQIGRWPLYSGAAFAAFVCVTMLLPPILAVPLIFVCVGMTGAALVGSIVAILWGAWLAVFRYRWRHGLSLLALPLMVLLTVPASAGARWFRDEARFYIHKERYETAVAEAKAEGKQYVVVDDWSIFVTANSFVVWDAWDKPEEVMGMKPYKSFGGHFYLVGD